MFCVSLNNASRSLEKIQRKLNGIELNETYRRTYISERCAREENNHVSRAQLQERVQELRLFADLSQESAIVLILPRPIKS